MSSPFIIGLKRGLIISLVLGVFYLLLNYFYFSKLENKNIVTLDDRENVKIGGDFDLLGKPQDPTYVIKYALNFPESITKFRLCLYDKIAQLIELKDHSSFKGRMVGKTISNKKHFIYSTPDGMPLYGIHEYYHGQSNWEPHISLFKLKEKSLFFKKGWPKLLKKKLKV